MSCGGAGFYGKGFYVVPVIGMAMVLAASACAWLVVLFFRINYCWSISKLLGARVVAVTAGVDKAAYLKRLGADDVIAQLYRGSGQEAAQADCCGCTQGR